MWAIIGSIALRLLEMAISKGAEMDDQRLDRLGRVRDARRNADRERDRVRDEIERRRREGE